MLSSSWKRYPDGSQEDPIMHSFIRGCLSMQRHPVWRSITKGSAKATGSYPQRGAPRWKFLQWDFWPQKWHSRRSWLHTRKFISSEGDPGGVQCTKDVVGEAHDEILEVIKACLWCRWGSSSQQSLDESSGCCGMHSITPTWSCPVTTLIPHKLGSNHPEERPGKDTARH